VFGKRVPLFTIFGFEVKLDSSWLILAVLITWTLSRGFFPSRYPGLSPAAYWAMGASGALGLFVSIVIHELSHSLAAARFGMPIKGITLFVFGGVAEMEKEPPSAMAEFAMAGAGPATSVALGALWYALFLAAREWGVPAAVAGVLRYLCWVNIMLAGFNLLPAFPLDGGRVLRAILWQWTGRNRWATRVSSRIGAACGVMLLSLGLLGFIAGDFIGGMWIFLIGIFLRGAAQMSYRGVFTRAALEGEPIRRFMQANPIVVSPSTSIAELVAEYLYRHHFKMFPVVDEGRLAGFITTREVKEIPREQWERTTVAQAMRLCTRDNTVAPGDDSLRTLATMSKTGNSRLMVVEHGRLVGVVTLKDLLGFLSLKMELEGEEMAGGAG
jgi:Zn-dependent protease/CBS domain-containing protein